MKKILAIVCITIISVLVFIASFYSKKHIEPNLYYQVYLDDQIVGTITSKKALEDYIDKQGSVYKNKYNVSKVYPPEGLEIKKIMTYYGEINSIKEVYNKISKIKPFTIKGYQITLRNQDETKIVYVTDEKTFRNAAQKTLETFVGKDNFTAYDNDTQTPISTVGTFYENIYIEESKTIKEANISVDEKIYTDVKELSQYLLFGTDEKTKPYVVQSGDTIEKVAFNNKISVEEFFISNPEFNSEANLLYPGQKVNIGYVDPVFTVVVITTNTQDQVKRYNVEYIDDPNMIIGDTEIIQKGSNGLTRVTTSTKTVNGVVTYVEPIEVEELKPTINEKVKVGQKYVTNIGSMQNWGWPTGPGWQITSEFGYRTNPFNWSREFHDAIDIHAAHGSPIYAVNNGTIQTSTWHHAYGYYIVINHNNGFYTLYAHMSALYKKKGQTVRRGDHIGAMGMTGWATGPHLHFGAYYGSGVNSASLINPWQLYR